MGKQQNVLKRLLHSQLRLKHFTLSSHPEEQFLQCPLKFSSQSSAAAGLAHLSRAAGLAEGTRGHSSWQPSLLWQRNSGCENAVLSKP